MVTDCNLWVLVVKTVRCHIWYSMVGNFRGVPLWCGRPLKYSINNEVTRMAQTSLLLQSTSWWRPSVLAEVNKEVATRKSEIRISEEKAWVTHYGSVHGVQAAMQRFSDLGGSHEKNTKINSEGLFRLFTKFSTHKNLPAVRWGTTIIIYLAVKCFEVVWYQQQFILCLERHYDIVPRFCTLISAFITSFVYVGQNNGNENTVRDTFIMSCSFILCMSQAMKRAEEFEALTIIL